MDILATYAYRTVTYNTAPAPGYGLGGFFAGFATFFIAMLVIGLLINMALTWGVYKKGGYKGWEGIVPFYNNYCLYKMADVDIVLFIIGIFLPAVNIYMFVELAKKFGKEPVYGVGLTYLGLIFMPILGYGSAKFQGVKAQNGANNASAEASSVSTTNVGANENANTEEASVNLGMTDGAEVVTEVKMESVQESAKSDQESAKSEDKTE